jgi:RNA polymerase sigma factor (sigma-70 family)
MAAATNATALAAAMRGNLMEENRWMADFYTCDSSKFDLVSSHWWELLFRYFRKHGCSSQDAEDLSQDTLMKIFLTKVNGNWFDPESGQFSTWIWTIAYRTLVSWVRNHRMQTAPFEKGHEPPAPPPQAGELRGDLEECCRKVLNDQERTFVFLWENGLGDMKQTEIAKVLGVGNPRVTAIKDSAMVHLEKCLRLKGYD